MLEQMRDMDLVESTYHAHLIFCSTPLIVRVSWIGIVAFPSPVPSRISRIEGQFLVRSEKLLRLDSCLGRRRFVSIAAGSNRPPENLREECSR